MKEKSPDFFMGVSWSFFSIKGFGIRSLYYKHVTIVNYASSSVNKLRASLNDDARVVIYDRHKFIVQATDSFSPVFSRVMSGFVHWNRISCKRITRWQHLSRSKASAFFSLQFFLFVKKWSNLYLGLVTPSSGWSSPILNFIEWIWWNLFFVIFNWSVFIKLTFCQKISRITSADSFLWVF